MARRDQHDLLTRRKVPERCGDAVSIGEIRAAHPEEGGGGIVLGGAERRVVRLFDIDFPAREVPLNVCEHVACGRERGDGADGEARRGEVFEHLALGPFSFEIRIFPKTREESPCGSFYMPIYNVSRILTKIK